MSMHSCVQSLTHSMVLPSTLLRGFFPIPSTTLRCFPPCASTIVPCFFPIPSTTLRCFPPLPSTFSTLRSENAPPKLGSRQKAARSLVCSGVKGCSTYGGNLTCLSVCSGVKAYSTYASTSRLPVCLCRCEGVLDSHRHVERGLYHGGAHSERPPAVRQKRNGADSQDLQSGGKPHG